MRPAALFLAAIILSADPQQPPPQRAAGTVTEGVNAVLVDVVVRDKRGQPVRDLTVSDFEVVEDGVSQKIGAFTPVFEGSGLREAVTAPETAAGRGTPGAGAGRDNTPGGGSAYGGPVVTALVFDRLSPEARRLAIQAARGYLGEQMETPSYIGIFGVDLSLTPYSPFTRNARVLRQALDRMAGRASSSLNTAEQQQARATAAQRAAEATQAGSAAIAGAGRAGGPGTSPSDAIFAQMESRALKEFEVMERDQSGYATTNGLFSIISAMRSLPGRKSLILFSEGIAIPPAVQRLFLGVIDAANRANVSIYTMDAAGLRPVSELAQIRDQVNQAAGGGGGILAQGGDAPLSKALEKNEDVLRQDPHFGLGTLAQSTGGMIFDSTNNLRQAFDRVETDLRNYYLVGYTPSNETYDGRFRTIDVKVKRSGVTVAARKGYYAVLNAGGAITPYEAPALGELERKPVPNAFPVRAGSFLFPERDRPGLVPVIVDLKTAGLTFQPAADGKTYTSDFTILVRFLDQRNEAVRKVSQHYEITGPIGEIQRAKDGEVLFYREPELAPGVYTMETVAYDASSGKSSVRLSTVEVPAQNAAALRLSSLMIVKRGEKVPEKERRAENPLLVKDVILYPNLGDPISKSAKEMGFYVAVYPAPGGPTPVASLEVQRDGVPVAHLPMSLAAPDASGRIQMVGRLPLDQIAPGSYELVVVVKQAGAQVSRSALVRITE